MRSVFLSRWLSFACLVAMMIALPTAGRSDDTKGLSPEDKKKKVEELQKQMEELKKKLEELDKPPMEVKPVPATTVEGTLPVSISKQITWRSVGPANMGGRIVALSVVNNDPTTYWIATASGGLLKTTNNGITFEHQFDKETTVSIGDVAHAPSKPDIVYVGTGENNPRNSVSYGDGVYKSTDGGKTWKNIGLEKTFQIGKIIVHPTNPDIVYVGALGRLYGKSQDRGLYKTEDGGKTWNKILYVDDVTGVIDMRMDPKDPNTLIVGMWGRMRDGFDQFFGEAPVPDGYGPVMTFNASGGIWKTSDAGKTFKKINDAKTNKGNGLPTVATGRIGIDYSSKTKGLLYAIVDSEKGGTGTAVPQAYMGIVGEKVVGGVEFTSVTEGSPADKAGLKEKDIVQVYDGKKADDYDAFLDYIRTKKPGDKLQFEVLRGAETKKIELTLGVRPEDEAAAGAGTGRAGGGRAGGAGGQGGGRAQGGRGQGGAGATAANRGIAGFTITNGTDSAKIATLITGGAAEKAGLKVGDEITAVDGKAVKSSAQYTETMGTEKKPGDKVKLTIGTGDAKKDVEVTLQAAGAQTGPVPAAGAAGPTMLLPGFSPATGDNVVTVSGVKAGSDAEKAGIKPGIIISKVEGKEVTTLRELMTELRTGPRAEDPRKEGEKVKVSFTIDGKEVTHTLTMVPVEMTGLGGAGGGPNRGASNRRPYGLGLGGQQPNVQDRQGPDGYQTGGVYMSKDNGETWTRVNSVNPRPMYFSQVRVDPVDDKIVYVLADTGTGGGNAAGLFRTTDGGKTFGYAPVRGVHADLHALWINPTNNRNMILGCDGGTYVTYDTGEHWDHLNHVAIAQFYHVAVDNRRPYRIYGGLQDNGSWGLPSATLRARTGPYNEDSVFINGGDGFVCRVDPNDPDLVYAESQGGAMNRRNLRTGESGFIRPAQGQGTEAQRFDWNTPFILSSHNPSIFYCQSQFVYRSINKGTAMKRISPETTLTKKGSGSALGESSRSADIVWAGTTDGGLWVTKDGGVKWDNVTPNLLKAGLSAPRWVATVEPSRERDGRCYIALDGHRSDDDKPYLFVTDDFGVTWKSINSNLPAFGSTRCLREDLRNPSLLYCGTEFGAYVSTNRGASWTKMGGNLPTVAVHEFAQPTVADEVVIATHGRSVWVTNVGLLRQMKSDTLKDAVTLFAPSTATKWKLGVGGESPYSDTVRKFVGKNPTPGTTIDYNLKDPAKSVTLKILDVTGKTVSEYRDPPKTSGLHRMPWEIRRGTITTDRAVGGRGQGGGGGGGGTVLAGVYKVVLTVDGKEYVQSLTVENDPNLAKDALTSESILVENEEDDDDDFYQELRKFLRPGG